MRLTLHVTLARVTGRLSPSSQRPVVGLEYEVVGQPDLAPLYDFYLLDLHDTWELLANGPARALGVKLGTETFGDHEACRAALETAVGRPLVLEADPQPVGGRGWRLVVVRQVAPT